MSLTIETALVQLVQHGLTAFTAAQNNFTAVELHVYDLRDSSTSSPITDTLLGN